MLDLDKMMSVHIGSIIERIVKEKGMSLSEFARRLNCDRSTVYNIFEQKDISTYRLRQISEILGHNFFSEFYESTEKFDQQPE